MIDTTNDVIGNEKRDKEGKWSGSKMEEKLSVYTQQKKSWITRLPCDSLHNGNLGYLLVVKLFLYYCIGFLKEIALFV